jgi:hypothetical protein
LKILIYLVITCLAALSPSVFAEPAIYRAEYVAEYQGLPVKAKATRELIKLDDQRYRLVSSAKSVLASVTESTEFELDDSDLSPVFYSYVREGLGKNKIESSRFDWRSGIVEHEGTTSELSPGTLDKLSYQYKLRADVAHAYASDNKQAVLEYTIADEEKRKQYRFRISGEEFMKTPIGELRAVRIDRIREDDERQTSLWLAVDLEFLLVKLIQKEKNRGFELNLKDATINGAPI